MVIYCPRCGVANTQNSSYCSACGRAMPAAEAAGVRTEQNPSDPPFGPVQIPPNSPPTRLSPATPPPRSGVPKVEAWFSVVQPAPQAPASIESAHSPPTSVHPVEAARPMSGYPSDTIGHPSDTIGHPSDTIGHPIGASGHSSDRRDSSAGPLPLARADSESGPGAVPGTRLSDRPFEAQRPLVAIPAEPRARPRELVESATRTREVIIGRDPTCQLVIDNPVVSIRHARIATSRDGLTLEDLGSTNGTYLNGVRIPTGGNRPQRMALSLSDDVRLGTVPVALSDARISGLLITVSQRTSFGLQMVIGSDSSCSIVIDSSQVGPRHAELFERNGEFFVRDLGTGLGTYLDAPHNPITEARVLPSSVLILGRFALPLAVLRRFWGADEQRALGRAVSDALALNRDQIRVGRTPDNELILPHPTVSAHHARLTRMPDGSVRIEDLGSTNGTYLDGFRVGPEGALARAGQRIAVGSVELSLGTDGRVAEASRAKVRLDLMQVGLTVEDRATRRPRVLLDRISMSIFAGEMVAMLGPSGAGKSTLLMTVLGLYNPTHGGILFNGRPLYQQFEAFRTNLGYVPQDDIVHPQLTVYEALWYACRLRLPAGTRRSDIRASIDHTLREVGLWEQRNLQIGSAEEKVLSGGQRRRVNLAVELVTDPSLLILDEPTSGLSWTDAADVIATLRQLADEGRTVVLTIHQPDYQEYEKFDCVSILGRGGKLLFYGPPSPDSYSFFGASAGKPREMFDRVEQVPPDEWRDRFHRSPTFQRFVVERAPSGDPAHHAPPPRPRRRSGWRQFPVLVGRSLKLTYRNATALALLLIQAPVLGLLIGLTTQGATSFATGTFGCRDISGADVVDGCAESEPLIACDVDVVHDEIAARAERGEPELSEGYEHWRDSRIRDPRTGLLAILMALFLPMIIASSNVLVAERTVYERERLAGLNITPYVLSRYLVLVLLGVVVTTSNLAVSLPLLELKGPPLAYWLVGVMVTSCAAAMGLALSAAVRSPVSALWGINFLVIPQLLFAGSITRLQGFTWYASWLTATRYALEALTSIDIRSRGHLRSCQVERYLENFPGFDPALSAPVTFAAMGTGGLILSSLLLTILLLWNRDKRLG